MKQFSIFILFLPLLLSCGRTTDNKLTAVSTVDVSERFDLSDIERSGELLALTLSGPKTYYEYHGRHFGVHYLLGERFAKELGVRLRVEVCRDTVQMLERLEANDADIILYPLSNDSLTFGWEIGEGKPELASVLRSWAQPQMISEVEALERQLLARKTVNRKVYSPMLSKGVISRYDDLFKRYGRSCNWDWRLLAAQCYQESTFDPNAQSWAGAKGLMQIMPSTADHLGLPRGEMFNPEKNIAAATRLLIELERELSDVHDRTERQNLALAAYNCGLNHLRDAQRLAARDGANPHAWKDVQLYILHLSDPRYYRDTLVHYGYMRGQETAEYVDKIRKRYQQYRRSVR